MVAVKAQLDQYIAQQQPAVAKCRRASTSKGWSITLLSDKAYYDSGSAELRPETKQLLDVVAGAAARTSATTCASRATPTTCRSRRTAYPTNWELSAARATGVTRYLVEHDKIVPTRISFAGYGQFRPKFPNDTDAHRQQNRRVDIVILNGPPSRKKTLTAPSTETEQAPATGTLGHGPSAAASSSTSATSLRGRPGGPTPPAWGARSPGRSAFKMSMLSQEEIDALVNQLAAPEPAVRRTCARSSRSTSASTSGWTSSARTSCRRCARCTTTSRGC